MENLSQLVVRKVPPNVSLALKSRAAQGGISAEQAHRDILSAALSRPRRKSFAEVLSQMPNVGADADFARR